MQVLSEPKEIFQAMGNKKGRQKPQADQNTVIHSPEVLDEKIENIRRIGWAVIGIYIALFGGLITWYLPRELGNLRMLIKGDTASQIEPIQSQIAEIQGELHAVSSALTLEKLSKSDRETFARSLPQLRKAAQQPIAKVNPDTETLQAIVRKLRTVDTSSPEYWPTVLQFISFASAGLSPDVPPPGEPQVIIAHNRMPPGAMAFGPIKGRRVLLDGGDLSNAKFYNCRVRFTRNPVVMYNVLFVNCVFEMPAAGEPNPYLQRAARTILASNLTNVSINQLPATRR